MARMVSMARKRITADIDIGRRHQYQYQFLDVTNRVCPEVPADLKKVLDGDSTLEEFLEHYGLRGTWLESAARSTLRAWRDNQTFAQALRWRLPSTAQDYDYGYPTFRKTKELIQTFHPTSYLYSPDAIKQAFYAAVDEDLEAIRQWAVAQGDTRKKRMPTELRLECASLYLFRGRTIDQLVQKRYATDRNSMWRGIRDVFDLLDLPLRGRGHGPSKYLKKRRP